MLVHDGAHRHELSLDVFANFGMERSVGGGEEDIVATFVVNRTTMY